MSATAADEVLGRIGHRAVADSRADRGRDGSLDDSAVRQAEARLRLLAGGWHEILPTRALRNLPTSLPFVSLDERLNAAAAREGFALLPAELPPAH